MIGALLIPLRSPGFVSRPGPSVTPHPRVQPMAWVLLPDCRSSIVGSGPFLSEKARCRAPGRRVFEDVCLLARRVAGLAFVLPRAITSLAGPVSLRSLSYGALVSIPGRVASRLVGAAYLLHLSFAALCSRPEITTDGFADVQKAFADDANE